MDSQLDTDDLELLRQTAELTSRLVELQLSNALAFYSPHRKQEMFHRAGDMDFRYVRTGNRFGKSEMGAAEDIAFALGERPWFAIGDPDRTRGIPKHPTKGLIITTDWDKSREVFTEFEGGELGKLFKYLPAACVKKVSKNSARAIERMVIARPTSLGGGESTICIDTTASYKQNAMSQESSAWDWIHIDEPIPEGQWIGASRGLVDRNGKAWFTCTPLDQPWINRKFLPNNSTQFDPTRPYEQHMDFEGEKVTTWMIIGSMDDNPHNSKAAIAKFFLDLSREPDKTATRRHGVPLSMSGLVLPEFSFADHIYDEIPFGWQAVDIPPKNYTIRLAIDPHPRIPMAVLFIATSPSGRSFVYREIFSQLLVRDLCDEILAITKGYYIQDSIIDPLAKTRDPVDDSCMMDEFVKCGVWCTEATKAKSEGILKAREILRTRQNNHPIFKVGRHCKRFLFEVDNWVYDPNTNKPIDKDDHLMEDFYRLSLTDLLYVNSDGKPMQRRIESDPDKLLDQILRNDFQKSQDFADIDEAGDIASTEPNQRKAYPGLGYRAAQKKRYHDAY